MPQGIPQFKKTIWDYYAKNRRSFPWRERSLMGTKTTKKISDAEWIYRVVISEIMLQQTQAPRVVEKFNSFMKKFPDFTALAAAPLQNVLAEWQGLGYNRRGMYVKRLAETIVTKYSGEVPQTKEELVELPAIGPHTAGSILAFAFNIAEPFIETNIRTVYIHFFFEEKSDVPDKDIYDVVAKTIDKENPREWFYALMDYGVMFKQAAREARTHDPAKRSKHYKKQSAFKGSNRQLRAALLKSILEVPTTLHGLVKKHRDDELDRTEEVILRNLEALQREGFIRSEKGVYSIAK